MNRAEHEYYRLLEHWHGWLVGQCRKEAADSDAIDAEDLYQEVVYRFLRDADKWFAGVVEVSPEARAHALLKYRLLNAKTDMIRKYQRFVEPEPEDSSGEPVDGVKGSGQDPQRLLEYEQLLEQIESMSNPVYRLLILMIDLPDRVTDQHFEAVAAYRNGNALQRPLTKVMALFEQACSREWVARDEWKERIAEILRCEAPIGGSTEAELEIAKGWLNRTHHRARGKFDEEIG